MTSTKLAKNLIRFISEKKGQDITILDVRGLTDVTDYFVLVSTESDVQAKAISDYLEEKSKHSAYRLWHKEGYKNLNWIILDYVDVVVHIFKPQVREYYSLERLWGDARIIRLEEDVSDRILLEEGN